MNLTSRRALGMIAVTVLLIGACSSPGSVPGGSAPAGSPEATAGTATPSHSASPTAAAIPSAEALGSHLLATIEVDRQPCAIAVDGSSAWVTAYGAGLVDRIDLTTNQVTDRVKTGGMPCGVAVGPDKRVWVADLGGLRVLAIDPATMQVTGEIDHLSSSLWDLKAGFGSVWVVDRLHQTLLRIDPATTKISQQITIGPSGGGLAITTDAVWVADTVDGTIRRVDPRTNVATITATVTGGASWFADDGASSLGVSAAGRGELTLLDAASGATRSVVPGWIVPRDGTVLGSGAWVPDGRAHAVRLVDLATGTVTTSFELPGGINPFVAEVVAGDIVVLDYGGKTAWRIRP